MTTHPREIGALIAFGALSLILLFIVAAACAPVATSTPRPEPGPLVVTPATYGPPDPIVGPLTGYDVFLINRYPSELPPGNVDRRCMAPNPDHPLEKCLHWNGAGHDGEHSWWFCTNEFGDYPSLNCELQRGHEGDHMGHWV